MNLLHGLCKISDQRKRINMHWIKIFILVSMMTCKWGVALASTLTLAGEYIYFQPILDSTFYAIPYSSTNIINGPRLVNQYGFSAGYRIEGLYHFFCDQALFRLRWSTLHASHQESTFNPLLAPANFPSPIPNFIPSFTDVTVVDQLSLDYHSWDIFIGWTICNNAILAGSVCLGLHTIKVANKQTDQFSGFTNTTPTVINALWTTNVHGIGPELGVFGEYFLPKCIKYVPRMNLKGSFQIGGIVLNNKNKDQSQVDVVGLSNSNVNFNFFNDKIQRIVPFWDLRLGIGKECYIGLCAIDLSFGYEILGYYHLLNRTLESSVGGPTFDFYSNLFFHGLFVNVGISY